jgi:hypothetical protein
MKKFVKLKYKTKLVSTILEYVNNAGSEQWFNSNGFDVLKFPKHLLLQDQSCAVIFDKFDCATAILRMKPNTFYKPHTDHTRGAAINLLLSGTKSNTFFVHKSYEPRILDVECLDYEQDHLYLLNVQQEHAVLNKDNVRYVLSIGFSNSSFEQILECCLAHDLV